jgi:hypothetical protein
VASAALPAWPIVTKSMLIPRMLSAEVKFTAAVIHMKTTQTPAFLIFFLLQKQLTIIDISCRKSRGKAVF